MGPFKINILWPFRRQLQMAASAGHPANVNASYAATAFKCDFDEGSSNTWYMEPASAPG